MANITLWEGVKLRFKYGIEEQDERKRGYRYTEAVMEVDGVEVGKGKAWCSPKDQFCRFQGRKLALGRALKQVNPHRMGRRVLWNQYWTITNKPEYVFERL